MITTHFSDAFTDKEKAILAKTFQANCQHLGINDDNCIVAIHRKELGPKRHQGSMARVGPELFVVFLNSEGFNLFEGISVLGHEATHIRQYLRGDLSDDNHGCNWRGQHFPRFICEASETYRDLPWEQEAFDLQPKLHTRSLDTLPRTDLKHVIEASEHAYTRNFHI